MRRIAKFFPTDRPTDRPTKFSRLERSLLVVLLSLSVVFSCASADAAVTLKPRYIQGDAKPIDADRENYVYFGKFDHRLWDTSDDQLGDREGTPTPILWRVMELGTSEGKSGAILLSHYLLEAMAYLPSSKYKDIGGDDATRYVRTSDNKLAHTWDGSDVQTWLNSAEDEVTVKLGKTDANTKIKGFLHAGYFSAAETLLMLNYPFNRHGEGEDAALRHKVVLPSGEYYDSGPYVDKFEMGTWFASEENKANNNTRKAHFKGGPPNFTEGSSDGWSYWTRSPVASYSDRAFDVYDGGTLLRNVVYDSGAAVRPAFFLNLESLIFKSGSDAFDPSVLGFTPSGEAGKNLNPFLLYTTSGDLGPQSVGVSGSTLTIKLPQKVAHAYTDTKDEPLLGSLFIVMNGTAQIQVDKAVVNGDTVTLTLAKPVAYGDTGITAQYDYIVRDTQGIGFLDSANNGLPTVWKGLGVSPLTVANNTPNPGGGDTGEDTGGDTDTTKTAVTIDGKDVKSAAVSGNTLTIIREDDTKTTYNLNQFNVTITYGEERFTVELDEAGELVVTGDDSFIPGGVVVVLTATESATTQAQTRTASLRRGAAYALGEAKAAIIGGKCVFTFPAKEISRLPAGTYDLTFATKSGANPAFTGTFATGYVHVKDEPAGPEILLEASETASGGGVQVSATVTSGDAPQAGARVTFTLDGAGATTKTTGADGEIAAFTLKTGLSNGTYSVSASATGYAPVSKSVTVTNGTTSGGEEEDDSGSKDDKSSGSGGCDFGAAGALGLFGLLAMGMIIKRGR